MSAARKRKAAPDLAKPRDRKAFTAWLTAGGAEIDTPRSQYEVIRFWCSAGLSIVYNDGTGRIGSLTGVAREAWDAFLAGEAFPYPASEAPAVLTALTIGDHPTALDGLVIGSGGITIADVMRDRICTMGAAIRLLRAAETTGRFTRSGGDSGTAYRWALDPPHPDSMERAHG